MARSVTVTIAAVVLAATLWFGFAAFRLASTVPRNGVHVCSTDCGVRDDDRVCLADSASPEGVICYISN